jgi:hypothetical protein
MQSILSEVWKYNICGLVHFVLYKMTKLSGRLNMRTWQIYIHERCLGDGIKCGLFQILPEDLPPEKESVDEDPGPDRVPSPTSGWFLRTDAHRGLRFEDEGSRILSRIETAPLVGKSQNQQ